ncbi:MAG: hypothetical protein WC822_03035 [Candidatus Paceibacterota bacterium]|jgi:hypothetical protein
MEKTPKTKEELEQERQRMFKILEEATNAANALMTKKNSGQKLQTGATQEPKQTKDANVLDKDVKVYVSPNNKTFTSIKHYDEEGKMYQEFPDENGNFASENPEKESEEQTPIINEEEKGEKKSGWLKTELKEWKKEWAKAGEEVEKEKKEKKKKKLEKEKKLKIKPENTKKLEKKLTHKQYKKKVTQKFLKRRKMSQSLVKKKEKSDKKIILKQKKILIEKKLNLLVYLNGHF